METIYNVNTNSGRVLISIDTENEIARCICENAENYPLCNSAEVEDTCSWEEIDFESARSEIEEYDRNGEIIDATYTASKSVYYT